MTRTIWFAIKLAVLVAVAYWLAERPGMVSVDWLGYRIDTSVGILLLGVGALVVVAALAYRAWRFMRRSPRTVGKSLQSGRRKRGYKALTQGMVAVAAGEKDEAARQARRAGSLLDEPPLTMLLSAQAAQLNGDEAAAKRYFTAMLDNPETRFLGLRGLLTQALREGDDKTALDLVRQAHAMRPRTPWVLTSLFELSERTGDLDAADRALVDAQKAKALPAPEAGRKRAVVLLEKALAAQRKGDKGPAMQAAREAHKLAPDLAPATALLAEQMIDSGQARKAAKLLEDAWARGPHPDLARLYQRARPTDDGIERLKRLGKLTAGRADHPESELALARAALGAKLWGEARRHLKLAAGPDGLDGAPGEAVCRLMAELEEAETGDLTKARAWLARAAEAAKDPAWVCRECGAVSSGWSAHCGACGAFDGLAWQPPPRAVPALVDLTAEAEAEPAPALPVEAEVVTTNAGPARPG